LPDLSPIQAVRRAARAAFAAVPAEEIAGMRDLLALLYGVPELRVRVLDELARSAQLAAELVAERTGRRTDELAVQTFAGALVGAMMAVMTTAAADPAADVLELMDCALELLERGLPL
jgi:hypothetical protein